jgi:hypothetical protein
MNRLALRAPRVTLAAGALALTAIAAACGGSSHGTNISSSATTAPSSSTGSSGATPAAPGGGAGGGGGAFPGASGSVAAISGQSMEVQNQQVGQVTVSWTAATRFSQMVTVPASSIAVGDCVTVTGAPASGAIVATTVTVSQPSSTGSCTGGFAGRRTRPAGTSPSSTFPTSGSAAGGTRPARAPGAGFGFATGKVTAVGTTTLTIDGFSSASFRPGSSTSTVPAAAPVTVDLKSTTTYHTTRAATSQSLAVGDCVTATGTTSSNGSVTASTVRITSTGGQACTAGAGRFGGFGGGPGGAGGGTSSNG